MDMPDLHLGRSHGTLRVPPLRRSVLRPSLLCKRVFEQSRPWTLMTAWICLLEGHSGSELNRIEGAFSHALSL